MVGLTSVRGKHGFAGNLAHELDRGTGEWMQLEGDKGQPRVSCGRGAGDGEGCQIWLKSRTAGRGRQVLFGECLRWCGSENAVDLGRGVP